MKLRSIKKHHKCPLRRKVKYGANIQKATRYLRGSQGTSKMAEDYKHFKRQETETLIKYIEKKPLAFGYKY